MSAADAGEVLELLSAQLLIEASCSSLESQSGIRLPPATPAISGRGLFGPGR